MTEVHVGLQNLGTVNRNKVIVRTPHGSVSLWFSYSTLVGVDNKASKNVWSRTTEKLLKDIEPDKSKRLPHGTIERIAQKKLGDIL